MRRLRALKPTRAPLMDKRSWPSTASCTRQNRELAGPRKWFDFGSVWLLAAVPLVFFLLFPLLALVVRGTLLAALGQLRERETFEALRLSVATTLIATFVIVFLGVPL